MQAVRLSRYAQTVTTLALTPGILTAMILQSLVLALVASLAAGLPLERGTLAEPNINPAIQNNGSSERCQSLYNTTCTWRDPFSRG